jgi:type IV secretory pathway VirB4 component
MSMPVAIRDILQARKETPFYNQIDVLSVEEDILIGAGGNLTAGFRLEGIDILLKSKQETAQIIEFLRKVFAHLPEKTQCQFILKRRGGPGKALYDYRYAARSKDELSQALVMNKFSALKRDRLFSTDIYLFVTKFHEDDKKHSRQFSFLAQEAVGISKERFGARKSELLTAVSQIENTFSNLKIAFTRLGEKEITHYIYNHLNPTRSVKIPLGDTKPDPVNNITLRSKLLYSAPVVEREHFYQDGYYYAGINLLNPPDQTEILSVERLLEQLDVTYDFALSFYIPDNEKEIEKLKTQANISKTFGFIGSSKNYDAAQKYAEIDSLITEIKSSSQKLANYSLSFLIRDREFTYLKRKENKILQAFSLMGSAAGISDHMNHDRIYLSFLPGQAWMNPRQFLIQTDALVNLLPIQATWRGTLHARTLMKTRKNELLKLDIFDNSLPAKHGLVVGTTGSGKSFTTNFILTAYLSDSLSNQLVIIDVGNSYRRLSSIFKGAYFDIDLSERYALNPLVSRDILYRDGEVDTETLAYLSLVVEKLVKGTPKDELTNADKRIIEKSILAVYAIKGVPILSDLLTVLQNYQGDASERHKALSFSKNLAIWTEGRYGKLLNRPGNIDVSNRFLVFELGKLDQYPDLQALVFFIIRSSIASKLYKPDLRKVIVIDEGWRFFNDEVGSRLIEDLYRTARKFNGLVLSISQSPEDFLSTKAAGAIISNSFTKYILKLNKGHELLKQFDLNESEVSEIKTLISRPGHFSELFVKFGEKGAIARLEPTPLEYWIATTDPEDLKAENSERGTNPHLKPLALLQHLAAQFPKGKRTSEESNP